MTDRADTPPAAVVAGRLLQTLVYAPIGAGARLVEDGPATIARARQELSNARFIGELVVTRGAAELRNRIAPTATEVPWESGGEVDGSAEVGAASGDEPAAAADALGDSELDDVVALHGERDREDDPAELALVDYDHLAAIDIVEQLDELTPDELRDVDAYERAHRRRRTVLGKIARILDDS